MRRRELNHTPTAVKTQFKRNSDSNASQIRGHPTHASWVSLTEYFFFRSNDTTFATSFCRAVSGWELLCLYNTHHHILTLACPCSYLHQKSVAINVDRSDGLWSTIWICTKISISSSSSQHSHWFPQPCVTKRRRGDLSLKQQQQQHQQKQARQDMWKKNKNKQRTPRTRQPQLTFINSNSVGASPRLQTTWPHHFVFLIFNFICCCGGGYTISRLMHGARALLTLIILFLRWATKWILLKRKHTVL